jgi:hypothetical protein
MKAEKNREEKREKPRFPEENRAEKNTALFLEENALYSGIKRESKNHAIRLIRISLIRASVAARPEKPTASALELDKR